MKATWNRIVQTLKAVPPPLPEAGTEPVLDADLQRHPPDWNVCRSPRLNWPTCCPPPAPCAGWPLVPWSPQRA